MDLETCIVYHWWATSPSHTFNNLRTPILPCILTLRGVNPDIPIFVFDLTEEPHDWEDFPGKLNFTVIPIKEPSLKHYQNKIKGWRYLSRIHDLHQFLPKVKRVIYADADVFWFRDPLPLAHKDSTKFCFDGWNTGFFYYLQSEMEEFFNIYDSYTRSAIQSHEFRETLKAYLPNKELWLEVWDEMILTFMVNAHKELFDIIPKYEHIAARDFDCINFDKAKMFHCNGTMVRNPIAKVIEEKEHSRGLMCLLVKEFYENMMKAISSDDLTRIYTEEELNTYLPKQFSLLRNSGRLKNVQNEDGMFNFNRCLEIYSNKSWKLPFINAFIL